MVLTRLEAVEYMIDYCPINNYLIVCDVPIVSKSISFRDVEFLMASEVDELEVTTYFFNNKTK